MRNLYIVLFSITIGSLPAFSQVNLDTGFGIGGKVVTPISPSRDQIYATAIQTDGKIVTVGSTMINSKYYTALARYNTNGALDSSFGTNGIIIPDFNTFVFEPSTVEILNDGKILVAGTHELSTPEFPTNFVFAMMRYNIDGTIDTGFGDNGTVITDFSPSDGGANGARDVIQDGNKLIVIGFTNDNNRSFGIAKYNLNGSLDTAFGSAGLVIVNVGATSSWSDTPNSVKLQSDGKIIIAGNTSGFNDANSVSLHDLAIIRLNNDGTLDTTFGTNGKAVHDFGENEKDFSMILTTDDKIILAGTRYFNSTQNYDSIIVKLNGDGSLDNSFGTNGSTITRTNPGQMRERLCSLILSADGKILCGGYAVNASGNADFLLMRFTSNGILDTAFNSEGYFYGDFNVSHDLGTAMAVQSDGKVILAGASSINGNFDFALARYTIGTLHSQEFASNPFKVYPNPTASFLNLTEANGTIITTVEIYDILGQLVMEKSSANINAIDVSKLQSGTYFIKITDENSSEIAKFIKN